MFVSSRFFGIINATKTASSAVIAPCLTRHYAARKGTRARREKGKVKVQKEKAGFIPHNLRNKDKILEGRQSRKFNDDWKRLPIDNVYPMKYYRWIVYPFDEAVKAHRETHHPEIYNQPNAPLHVSIELNMQGEKKTKFVDNFNRTVAIKHKFNQGDERSIIVFAKNEESQREALKAGAQLAGGVDLIKQIQGGQLNLQDFRYVAAHPDILPELVVLRGLMKRKFPNPKLGTLELDLGKVVDRYLNGITYTAQKDEFEKDFGLITTIIGTLDMDPKHLEVNFSDLVKDVQLNKPKRAGSFITRCLLWSPPSQEELKVDHTLYLDEPVNVGSEEEEEIQEQVKQEITL
ncbi:large ribosomal subunit protein uL1m [Cylas formicarius]|uniref:large ribosomal subunit protein uL1m n=1 Tax=Cylas formicarius TaxID=197179 RepID=UPI00295863AA|nr:large ribosomal subunit protein uL1m [Cylas formicarius]